MSSAPTPSSSRLSLAELCSPSPTTPTMTTASTSTRQASAPRHDDSPRDTHYGAERPSSLTEEEESVMIAVLVLDDMRSRAVSSSSSSQEYRYSTSPQATPVPTATSSSTSSPTHAGASQQSSEEAASTDFVSRVSGLPIVTTALRAYEHSKASSRVVKYGAEMMESSVKSISRPVIERLPVNQLDEFACRQLDRFGSYSRCRDGSASRERGRESEGDERRTLDEEGDAYQKPVFKAPLEESTSRSEDDARDPTNDDRPSTNDVVARSRWHNILYEASGLSAAVSDESLRRLKFCLQWLQYATDRIDGQVLILRNFIGSLNAQDDDGNGGERPVSASHMQTLTNVKRDVVSTIRQVVDVVSKYAGGALPEPARTRVRQFILHLPQRWANTAHRQAHVSAQARIPSQIKGAGKRRRRGDVTEPGSAVSTAPSSPLQSPIVAGSSPLPAVASGSSHRAGAAARPTTGSATQAAQRILTLATESLDMMRGVTGVFKESLDRAETWVERLRAVGINRGTSIDDDEIDPVLREATFEQDLASATTTSTFTSFPPSPRSLMLDAPSPGGLAVASMDALSLSSYATPKSSTQSLPSLAGYDWEYTTRKLQIIKDDSLVQEDKGVERSAISALRGTAIDPPGATMEVDDV